MKIGRAFFPCILLVSFFGTNAALATTELNASAGVRLAYHDNLFLRKNNIEDDLLAHLKAQIGFAAKRPKAAFNINYRVNFIFHEEHDELDETALKDVSRLSSRLNLGDWAGFSLLVEDSIDRVSVDESDKVNEDSDAINKTNRNTFRVTPSYEKDFSKTLRFQASYQFEDISHTNTAADERQTQAVSSTLTKTLSQRLALYILGLYQDVDAQNTIDYFRYDGVLGGRYSLTRTALLSAEAGVAQSQHETESNRETTAIWDLSLVVPTGQKITTTAAIRQQLGHAELDGLYRSRVWKLSAANEGRVAAEADLYHADDDYLLVNRQDKKTGAGVKVKIKMTPIMTARSSLGYTKIRLEPVGEKKDVYRATAGLEYEHQHFVLSGSYSFQKEESNITLNGYVSNVFFVELTARM